MKKNWWKVLLRESVKNIHGGMLFLNPLVLYETLKNLEPSFFNIQRLSKLNTLDLSLVLIFKSQNITKKRWDNAGAVCNSSMGMLFLSNSIFYIIFLRRGASFFYA